MDRKVYGMIVATIFITMVVWFSIQLQISIIDGLGEATVDNSDFQGDQIAGSFHILTRDGKIGEISSSTFNQIGDGCTTSSIPGFSGSDSVRFRITGDRQSTCVGAGQKVKAAIRVEGENQVRLLIVDKIS